MSDDEDSEEADTEETEAEEVETEPAEPEFPDPPERSTAPQSDYTMRDVGVGVAVMLVGVVLTFVVPILI